MSVLKDAPGLYKIDFSFRLKTPISVHPPPQVLLPTALRRSTTNRLHNTSRVYPITIIKSLHVDDTPSRAKGATRSFPGGRPRAKLRQVKSTPPPPPPPPSPPPTYPCGRPHDAPRRSGSLGHPHQAPPRAAPPTLAR